MKVFQRGKGVEMESLKHKVVGGWVKVQSSEGNIVKGLYNANDKVFLISGQAVKYGFDYLKKYIIQLSLVICKY